MHVEKENNKITLLSGCVRHVPSGIIGLTPDARKVTGGWETTVYHPTNLTRADLLDLADYMIDQWLKFKENIGREEAQMHD